MPSKLTNKIAIVYWREEFTLTKWGFYRPIFTAIKHEIAAAGKEFILYTGNDEKNLAPQLPFSDLMKQVDGFIVIDMLPQIYNKIETLLKNLAKPIVVLNYENISDEIDSVVFDAYRNARRMVQFLINLGHSRIGYLSGPSTMKDRHESTSFHERRMRGYRDILTENHLPFEEQLIVSISSIGSVTAEAVQHYLRSPQRPTAVFCETDGFALVLNEVAQSLNIKVPDELTIVGYDGIPEAAAANPPLTTMATPLEEMGIYGTKRLLEKIEEKTKGVETHYKIVLPGRVQEGKTHKRIK